LKVYIAGPMTGLLHLNFPAFHGEAARLRYLGHEVLNPAEINPDTTAKWRDCMAADIKALVDCQAISMLPGWRNSRGARIEHFIAQQLGMKVYEAGNLIEVAA
jgi:hypothetical protein